VLSIINVNTEIFYSYTKYNLIYLYSILYIAVVMILVAILGKKAMLRHFPGYSVH